jgi:tRNA modification GTPase
MAGCQASMCLLTPLGEGGIGIIALWGPGAPAILARCFRGTRCRAGELDPGRLAHGHIGRGADILDEVILARLAPPYPGAEAPYFEVNCHGGVVAVRAVMDRLAEEGAGRSPLPVAHESLPPLSPERIRQEALAALQQVPTQLGALVLLHQSNGALTAALTAIRESLLGGSPGGARRLLADLLGTSKLGLDLLSPPRVALLGPPNAGKSTLLNALLEEERVIVHHEPGTTRDVIVERVSVRGVPFDLMDSAGIRDTTDEVEAEAVRRARRLAGHCDVALVLFDAAAGPPPGPEAIPQTAPGTRVLLVANKIDLPAGDAPPETADGRPVVAVSALERRGIRRLEDVLLAPYGRSAEACRGGGAVVFTRAQQRGIEDVMHALDAEGTAPALRSLQELTSGAGASEPEAGHDQVEQGAGGECHEEHDG